MRFAIVFSVEGVSVPVFVTRDGRLSTNVNDSETFSTLKEACEAAMNVCPIKGINVTIEPSSEMRRKYDPTY